MFVSDVPVPYRISDFLKLAVIMKTLLPSEKTFAQLLQRQPLPPPPTLPPPVEPQNQPPDLVLPIEQPLPAPPNVQPPPTLPPPVDPQNQHLDLVLPIEPPLPALPNVQQQNNHLDFPTLVVAVCLTAAIEIAIRSLQNHNDYPITFHLLSLMIVFAFASIFVAKYIAHKKPNVARVLESVGVFFGVTAFFLAVTISFPLCLRIISWIIYALSLLAILICNCP